MKQFAKAITTIIHPATLALPAVFLIVFHEVGVVQVALFWTFLASIFVGLIMAFILYGVKNKFFNNIDVSNGRQRFILYPFIIFVVLLSFLTIPLLSGPVILIHSGIFLVISLLIFDIVNIKIKASFHVASVASLSIILISLYGGLVYLTSLFIPVVAWARIVEKRHTLKETIVGGILGCILTLVSLLVIQYI